MPHVPSFTQRSEADETYTGPRPREDNTIGFPFLRHGRARKSSVMSLVSLLFTLASRQANHYLRVAHRRGLASKCRSFGIRVGVVDPRLHSIGLSKL